MTERPSAEAQALAETIYKWQGYAFLDGRVAEAIDALCEQRISAETERCRNRDRQRLEQIERLQETVGSFQSASAERPAPEGPQLSAEAWAYLAGLGGYGPTDVQEAARLYPMPVEIPAPSALASTGEQSDFARCLQCVSHELTRDVCGYAGRCVRQAFASEDQAAAIRAFGQRVWSDTEEVAYQAGVRDTREKLQEPNVREAVIEALRKSRWPSIKKLPPLDDLAPGIRKMYERNADAALTKITEMLK